MAGGQPRSETLSPLSQLRGHRPATPATELVLVKCQAVDGHLQWLSLFNMNMQSLAHLPM